MGRNSNTDQSQGRRRSWDKCSCLGLGIVGTGIQQTDSEPEEVSDFKTTVGETHGIVPPYLAPYSHTAKIMLSSRRQNISIP